MRLKLIIAALMLFGWSGKIYAQSANADSLMLRGNQKYSQSKYHESAELYRQAMVLYGQNGDSLNWAKAKEEHALSFVAMGAVQEGVEILHELETEHIQAQTKKDKAAIKKAIGYAYRQLEQYDTAKNYYLEGLELLEGSHDSLAIASLYNNISYTFSKTGDYEQALKYQHQARRLFEKLNEDRKLALVLNGIFLSMMDLGMHQQAEPYIRQSLNLSKQVGNPQMLDVAYHNLAWNFERRGIRDSSIIYYRKSLELTRQLGNPYDMTITLNKIGGLYESSGDYDNALAYYNEALEANYKTDRPVSIAHNLRRLARVAIQNDDLENAGAFYQEAQNWMSKASVPRDFAILYLDMAELEMIKKEDAEAEKYLNEAATILKDYNFATTQARMHLLKGRLYRSKDMLLKSLDEYRKAYKLAEAFSVTDKIYPAIYLARAYNQVESDSAFYLAEQAFNLIDSVRTNVAGLAFRSGFFRDHAGFYNEVASWYITQKNEPEKAFDLIEAAKARVLMDELAEAQERVYENMDEVKLIKKQQLAKQIDRQYRQIEQSKSQQERSDLRDELKDLEFEYQTFLNELHVSNPALRNFKYPQPIHLEKVQEMLDRKSLILEYAFAGNSLVRILISQKKVTASVTDSIQTADAKSEITEQVRSFRDAITGNAEVDEIKRLGSSLYQYIIPNLRNEGTENLLVVSDGPLTFLPFEALTHQGHYLIEEFNIKYLPSISIYPFINAPERASKYTLLAVAGSGFDGVESLNNTTRSQTDFASLPSTLLEVDSISVNFPDAKILKNEEVSEAALKSYNLGDFRFLHFATHASVNELSPSQSGLLLSKKTEEESLFGEDGHLNSREISGLKLQADLVTLSACNTGMGKVVTGEGLLGLQRSFLSAGASSVIVSLWSIFDRSTSEFMSVFYKQMLLHEKEDYGLWNQTLDWFGMYEHPLFDYKAKALRDSKLAMIDHPYYNHPVYWAPFILIGK